VGRSAAGRWRPDAERRPAEGLCSQPHGHHQGRDGLREHAPCL